MSSREPGDSGVYRRRSGWEPSSSCSLDACVAAAVLTGAQVGVFQVAIVWGDWHPRRAIYLTVSLSGAHLEPCGDVGLRRLERISVEGRPALRVGPVCGSLCRQRGSVCHFPWRPCRLRGHPPPHPGCGGKRGDGHDLRRVLSESARCATHRGFPGPSKPCPTAFFAEAAGTCILMMVILALCRRAERVEAEGAHRSHDRPHDHDPDLGPRGPSRWPRSTPRATWPLASLARLRAGDPCRSPRMAMAGSRSMSCSADCWGDGGGGIYRAVLAPLYSAADPASKRP